MRSLWNWMSFIEQTHRKSSHSMVPSSSNRECRFVNSSLFLCPRCQVLVLTSLLIFRCVYYCMEYMDAGSMDRLQIGGVPEDVLARIGGAMVRGLKFLKDKMNIIHRGKYTCGPVAQYPDQTSSCSRREAHQCARQPQG